MTVNELSFLLERGSRTAFVGQNGQGKSTLAKIGKVQKDPGQVHWR